MAHRKDVFQAKVLQKLYPPTPKPEREPNPPSNVEDLSKKLCVRRKAIQVDSENGDAGKTQTAANPGRRLYTVLPPPAGYEMDSEKSVPISQLENINSAEKPAEEINHDSNEESSQDEEGGEQRSKRRRRRKNKKSLNHDSGADGATPVSESSRGQSQTPVLEGGEPISKNRKRKLKKKRHKEKLHSMGLIPQAAALEFTYQKDEEEDMEKRAAEVADFLRTTMEIYMSDSTSHVDKLPLLSETMDDLLSSITSCDRPSSVLKQLYTLKVLVQQKETDKLGNSLEDLKTTSSLSEEETTALVSLFQYWITDIFPMQGGRKTGLSITHS